MGKTFCYIRLTRREIMKCVPLNWSECEYAENKSINGVNAVSKKFFGEKTALDNGDLKREEEEKITLWFSDLPGY